MQGGVCRVGPLRAWVSPQNQGHGSRRARLEAGAGWTSGLHQAALLSDAVLGNQRSSHGSHFWWSWRACRTTPFCHLCVVPAAPSTSESIGLSIFVVHRKMEAQRRPELGAGLKPQSGHIYQALQTGFLFESQLKMECKKME